MEETTREERDAYLSEIRSAREAYLCPTGEVARMRAALRLMVLLTRAPDVEASMRGRQQLIVPGWDEREWQRDTANLRAHIGATHVHTESNVRSASIYAHNMLRRGRRSDDLRESVWRLTSALTAARLIDPRDETLGDAVGAHGQQPAWWWLDVEALLDDECEGAQPSAIAQLINATAPTQAAHGTAATYTMSERGPIAYEARAEGQHRMVSAIMDAAGDVPPVAERLRGYIGQHVPNGLQSVSVPLIAPMREIDPSTGATTDVRNATLRIERMEIGVNGARTADDFTAQACELVRRDLSGAMILSVELRESAGSVRAVLTHVPAEDVAELARLMGEG